MQKDEQKKKYSKAYENPFGLFCLIVGCIIFLIFLFGAIFG